MKENLIAGLGNILLCDEGIGVHLHNKLKVADAFPGTEYLDLGTSSYDLVNYIHSDVKKLILIDCIDNKSEKPGYVVNLTVNDLLAENDLKLSLHQMKLIDTLSLISIEHKIPETLIIGVVPHDTASFSTSISKILKEQFDHILNEVTSRISDFINNDNPEIIP